MVVTEVAGVRRLPAVQGFFMSKEPDIQTLGESENYTVWVSNEADLDEVIYHIEINNVTFHLFESEWKEFVDVMMQAMR